MQLKNSQILLIKNHFFKYFVGNFSIVQSYPKTYFDNAFELEYDSFLEIVQMNKNVVFLNVLGVEKQKDKILFRGVLFAPQIKAYCHFNKLSISREN